MQALSLLPTGPTYRRLVMAIIQIAGVVALLLAGAVVAAGFFAAGFDVLVRAVGRLADWMDRSLWGGQ